MKRQKNPAARCPLPAALAAALLLLVGCSTEVAPQEPVWGKQPCKHCAMLVSERQSAAQLLLHDGTRHYFDDVGCMVSWEDREKLVPRAQWVRVGDGWMSAEAARYQRAHTPMDYGYVGAREGVEFTAVQAAVLARGKATEGRP